MHSHIKGGARKQILTRGMNASYENFALYYGIIFDKHILKIIATL